MFIKNIFAKKRQPETRSPFSLSINDYFKMQSELKAIKAGPGRDIECSIVLAKYLMPSAKNIENMTAGDAMRVLGAMKIDTKEMATSFPRIDGYTVIRKMSDLSIAQFIDLQMSLSKIETNPEYALSVFIIPDGHSYNDGYDTDAHIQWLRDNIAIGDSNYIIDFFLKRCLKYTRRILLFFKLKAMVTRMPKERKKAAIKAYDALITQIQYIRGFA